MSKTQPTGSFYYPSQTSFKKNFLPASRTIDFILWFEKNGHVITGLFFFTARSAEFVDPMQCSGNAQCLGQAMTQTMLNF